MSEIPLWLCLEDSSFQEIRFNRHEIMHGITVDYGIEENFWKAVSLLYFMAKLIRLKKIN